MITKSLQKKEHYEVALDPDMVKQAKQVSGEFKSNFIPFIPLLQINNKKEKKMVEIDGLKQEVEVPSLQGFLLTIKNKETKEYEQKFYSKELSAVILKARYQIRSKFNVIPPYFSEEFDNWDQIIKVYNRQSRSIIGEGTYSELKELFKTTDRDLVGRFRKSFELLLVLYLDIDGEILRFKSKMSSYNNWFDYKNTFAENDTYVAYKTNFVLKYAREGKIEFWYVAFEKGEMIDLGKEIELQKELQMALNVTDKLRVPVKTYTPEIVDDESSQGNFYEEEKKSDNFNTSQIPF